MTTIDYEAQAREKLERAIENTLGGTQAAVERVMTEVPQDSIVRGTALDFRSPEKGVLEMVAGNDHQWRLHRNAVNQLAGRANIPQQYFDRLQEAEDGEWQSHLLHEMLRTTYQNSGEKYLIRAVKGEARGFLSDRYRRLDSRPILETFLNQARTVGAVPYSGVVTDTRVALKALLPVAHIFPALKGASGYPVEAIAVGIEWSNSDFGLRRNVLSGFILRLWCINGAVMESLLKQVHLGGRLDENIEYSRETYALDTKATVSAVKDATKALLGPDKVTQTVERCKALAVKEVDWAKAKSDLAKKLTKDELRRVDEAFTGPDVVNLPEGTTVWRASNALSWLANAAESAERKLELERAAGALLKEAA
jgi:hypothetical protein